MKRDLALVIAVPQDKEVVPGSNVFLGKGDGHPFLNLAEDLTE